MMTIFSQPLLYTFISLGYPLSAIRYRLSAVCRRLPIPDPDPNPNPNPDPDPDSRIPIPDSPFPIPIFSNSPLPCIIDTIYLTI